MRRLLGGIAAVVALALLGVGAEAMGAPVRTAGPMNIDTGMFLGTICLVSGAVLLEGVPKFWRRRVCLLGALVIALIAGRNLYLYPPIDDGAYFLLRSGREGAEGWAPADVSAHAIAFAAAGWGLVRAATAGNFRHPDHLSTSSRQIPGRLR